MHLLADNFERFLHCRASFLRSCWTGTESSRDQVFVPTEWQRIRGGRKKKINKSRATLVLSMVIPKKDDAGQRCGHCPFGRVPFSHTSSTGWIFCLLYGRNWLSPSPPPIIPLRALLSRNRISMDGQRPEPEGLDLRNFLKSDSGDAVRIGDGIGEGWKTFSVSYRGWRFGKIEVRRYILVVRKTLLGYLCSLIGMDRRMFVWSKVCNYF